MELEEDEVCNPADGFFEKGHPECLRCHYLAQALCKVMAHRAGKPIEEIEGLFMEEDSE